MALGDYFKGPEYKAVAARLEVELEAVLRVLLERFLESMNYWDDHLPEKNWFYLPCKVKN